VCVHGFFCTQVDVGECMSTANSHECLFFYRLALYVWRALENLSTCASVCVCVFIGRLV